MELSYGAEYYVLNDEQHELLLNLLADTEFDLATDFGQAADGMWYAGLGSIDDEEYEFLMENDLCFTTVYAKSGEAGGGM
jgi:hypothetical protein